MKAIVVLIFLTSCSQLKFASSGGLPMSWGAKPGHNEYVKIEGKVPLYLWGIVVPPTTISLNKEFSRVGALSVSKLTVVEDSDFEVWWQRLVTFGMYWPVKWRAEAFVQKASNPGIE